jgi:MYND finger
LLVGGGAGMAGAAADALLAHLRRYVPVLQLLLGAGPYYMVLLELAVMLQAPLRCASEALLCCAECGVAQALLPPGQHTKSCSSCECVRYCSTQCQARDWRGGHKRLCAALAALRSGGDGGGRGAGDGGSGAVDGGTKS